jgi:hypothetical protein
MRRRLALFVGLLVAAFACTLEPALASSGWYAGTSASGNTIGQLARVAQAETGVAFLHVDSTATPGSFSRALSTLGATELSLSLIPDHNGVTPAPSCELRVWSTAATGASVVATTDGLLEVSADTDGDGVQNDATLDGSLNRRGISGVRVPGIMVEVVTPPGSGEQCFLFVRGSF